MSKYINSSYTCPKCGEKQEFSLWQSVNAQINPELVEKILNREFYSQTCTKCGNITDVVYTFLYHDMSLKLMIYLVVESEPNAQAKMIEEIISTLFASMDEDYKKRIVTNYNQLLEKIAIFRDGLDDRAVEFMKLFYVVQVQESVKDKELTGVYYISEPPDPAVFLVTFDNGEVASMNFDEEIYTATLSDIQREKTEATAVNGFRVVDRGWALGFLAAKSGKDS